ncbi:MAG: endonuclease domain-containing protein [Armatimonadota bacterium]
MNEDKADIIAGTKSGLKRVQSKHLRRNQTPAEKTLWTGLRGNRLGGLHFRRQQIIDGYIADFYCHAAALVIEVDGDVHAYMQDEDTARQRVLERRGLQVLRVTNAEVARDPRAVLEYIFGVATIRIAETSENGVLPPTPP